MSQEFKIHQFHYSAAPGDAVTNHLFLIQKALLKIGIQGSIFAVERKHLDAKQVLSFKKEHIWDCDLLLLHHSHGNPALPEVLNLEIPKALVYHNVTPARFYPHDPTIQRLCRLGRTQLHDIRENVIASFADSKYNASELLEIGFKDVQLLPLLDLSELQIPETLLESMDPKEAKNLLFVGRLSPHKNQRLLIESFFYLKPKLPRHSRLIIVGGGDPVYLRYLKLLTKQLGIAHSVQFTGTVTDKELSHLYESADALVCTSLHEGFCIPLVEAIKQRVPVFYLPEAAIPETMGDAGVRLETKSPVAIAEILSLILSDEKIRNIVVTSQSKRLEELKKEQTPARLVAKILPILQGLETRHFAEPQPIEQHAT